jgi:hypothetical protein
MSRRQAEAEFQEKVGKQHVRRVTDAPAIDGASKGVSFHRISARACLVFVVVAAFIALAGPAGASAACPNEEFRVGPSAHLPDCRAYELVTPRKVNGVVVAALDVAEGSTAFASQPALASGDSFFWKLVFSGLPETESNGRFNLYRSQRTADGWTINRWGPTVSQAQAAKSGGFSRDQRYMVFGLEPSRGGSLATCLSCYMAYIRYPHGTYHLAGEGTVPTGSDTDGFENGFVDDLFPDIRWISRDGSHQIFRSEVQLTPEAPAGQGAIYDRTPSGLKLASLLPGEVPPTSSSVFEGVSDDGSTVMFQNEGNLYARIDNAETQEVALGASGQIFPGGVSEDGSRAFYAQEGNIYVHDTVADESSPVATPGNAIIANVSADGSHVYFLSESQLVPDEGTLGAPNLYVWDGEGVDFIATLNSEDVASGFEMSGVGVWEPIFPDPVFADPYAPARKANPLLNTSRTTPDGAVFVFESSAQLTTYPNEGFKEIYRYDTGTKTLLCVSCSEVSPGAGGGSELAVQFPDEAKRVARMSEIPNVSPDGQQIVFDSRDRLLPDDTNGVRDVYQWRNGALSLISTGHSPQASGLYGVTASGNDVFIVTGQSLVGQGQEAGVYAIYDARVGGGLASQQTTLADECVGEACQGQPQPPPSLAEPGSTAFHGRGNVKSKCKRRHHHGHRHHRPAAAKKASKKPCKAKHRRVGK